MRHLRTQDQSSTKRHTVAKLMRTCGSVLFLAGMLLGSLAVSTPTVAQTAGVALDRKAVAKELNEKHHEKPVGMGLADNGGVLELFSSEDGETWTMILTMPNGKSFLVGSGKSWAGAPVFTKGSKI